MALVYGSTATNLDFQNQRYFSNGQSTTFDNLITFSRGSLGTIVDSTGKITYAPNNLLTYSQQFNNALWVKAAGVSVSANSTIAPDGTNTANIVTYTTGGTSDFLRGYPTMIVGTKYIVSIWAKLISGNPTFTFDYGNVEVSTAFTLSDSWQRFSWLFTYTGINSWIDIQASTSGIIAFWGAQVEAVTYQTTPSEYKATTSSAYYGPRFDYDPVTLQPKGLLIEESRTNAFTYSEQFDNGAWSKEAGASITANQTVAPDGTTSADLLTVTSGNLGLYQVPAGANSTTYTTSVYAKAGTVSSMRFGLTNQNESADCYYDFDLSAKTGTLVGLSGFTSPSYSITDVGNGWNRCVVSATSPASGTTNVGAFLRSNNIGNFSIWGIQRETGAFATSYIPTGSATVQRNADNATITGTNFSSWYNPNEGTIYSNWNLISTVSGSSSKNVWHMTNSSLSDRFIVQAQQLNTTTTRHIGFISNSAQIILDLGSLAAGDNKDAFAYAIGSQAAIRTGASILTSSVTSLPAPASEFRIGQDSTNGYLNGWMKSIRYYNKRLPNAQLQALTA